jgi:hypothetical protein
VVVREGKIGINEIVADAGNRCPKSHGWA